MVTSASAWTIFAGISFGSAQVPPPPPAAPPAPAVPPEPMTPPPDAGVAAAAPVTMPARDAASTSAPLEDEHPSRAAPPVPPRKGLGLLISGGVVSGSGLVGVLIGAGIALSARNGIDGDTRSLRGITGALTMAFASIPIAVGIPLLAVGGVRYSRYKKWKRLHSLTLDPSMARTPFGTWVPGLALRF